MTTQSIPFIFNGNGTISLMIDGKMKPIDTAHRFYAEIKQAIVEKAWEKIPGLVNIVERVEQAINSGTAAGKVKIVSGEVFYNETRIHNSLTDRIVAMAHDGFDIGFMVKFLENLMQNPSNRAVNELYSFLEAGNIPITDDGKFLAYKKIHKDWKDIYSGTMDNSVGTVVRMPRNMVNEDSSVTCSHGLHVCSYNYLPHFGDSYDSRVVIVSVCPSNVVSVPKDYKDTKMRVCEYTVISEVENYKDENVLSKKSVFASDSKSIGKRVSAALESHNLKFCDFRVACLDAGLDASETRKLVDLARNGEFKRVGKKLSYFIENGTAIKEAILATLNTMHTKF